MKYKSLFISDLHLGTYGFQADKFLSFMKDKEFENIFIIGDFIDFWILKRSGSSWNQSHSNVIEKLLKKHKKGAKIVYIYGNHDESISEFVGENFSGIQIEEEYCYKSLTGKKILLIHGHQLDVIMKYSPWLAHIGSWGYDFLIHMNIHINKVRNLLGFKHWSLSKFVKSKVKTAVNFIGSFEKGITTLAKDKGYEAVMCGHIHCPDIKNIDNITYFNTGDFVESISCIVENLDGTFELLQQVDGKMKSKVKLIP